jgi:hypothetical protein
MVHCCRKIRLGCWLSPRVNSVDDIDVEKQRDDVQWIVGCGNSASKYLEVFLLDSFECYNN